MKQHLPATTTQRITLPPPAFSVVDLLPALCYTYSMERSITSELKDYLNEDENPFVAPKSDDGQKLDSVYKVATVKGMTLREYVLSNAATALLIAEKNVAGWNDLLTEAILTGSVKSEHGKARINKNITDLFKLKITQANQELVDVKRITDGMATEGDTSKTQRLLNTLYNRAVEGDTKALLHIIDRMDGKVGDKNAQVQEKDNAANVYLILHSLFDKQLQVINSGPGTKVVCCSRRSGKSHLAVAMALISTLSKPNTMCIYIGETAKLADKIFDKAANTLIENCDLRDKKGQRLNWRKLDNGSEVIIRGLSNTKDPDTIRGFKAEVIIIDEFFHLKSELLEYLQSEVLEPMQLDYAQSYKMLLIGTPPKMRRTYGEMVWTETQAPKFNWTWRDNPYIKNGEDYLKKLFEQKGIDPNSAYARREFGGEWVYDSDFLLYPAYYTYNPEVALPAFTVSSISIGVDYGTADSTAIIGVAWDTDLQRGYVFSEDKFNIMTSGGVGMIQQLKMIARRTWMQALDFFPSMDRREANRRITWHADSNGSSQMLTQELARGVRFQKYPDLQMQIVDAHRSDGKIMQDKIRDLLRTSALLLPEGGPTAMECELTALKRDPQGNPTTEIDDKVFHPDLLAALRYAMWPLVGHKDVAMDGVEILEGITYGGSMEIDFETSLKPMYAMGEYAGPKRGHSNVG